MSVSQCGLLSGQSNSENETDICEYGDKPLHPMEQDNFFTH